MAIPISTLENFKLETTFGDGYVVHTTYEMGVIDKAAEGNIEVE